MARNNVLDRIPEREWRGLVPSFASGRFHLLAKCSEPGCTNERVWTARTVFDPKGAVARVHSNGWETGKRVICPACLNKKKKEKAEMPKPERPTLAAVWPKEEPANDAPAQPVPSDAAKRAKRMVYMALEDYYDDSKKGYKSPHSDASIAKELGVSEALVAKIREEDFGPLAEPSELAALRKELGDAVLTVADVKAKFNAELAALQKQAERIQSQYLANTQAVLDKVQFCADRLEALCTKNGWRA